MFCSCLALLKALRALSYPDLRAIKDFLRAGLGADLAARFAILQNAPLELIALGRARRLLAVAPFVKFYERKEFKSAKI